MELVIYFVLAVSFFGYAESVEANSSSSQVSYPPIHIVYTSDIQGRAELINRVAEVDSSLKLCTNEKKDAIECYGGLPRLAKFMEDAKTKDPNTIFLTSGNFLSGRTGSDRFEPSMMVEFMNKMPFTATSLGEREIDGSFNQLINVINTTKCGVVTSNLWYGLKDDLKATKLTRSYMIDVPGHKIGIIGYTTPVPNDRRLRTIRVIDEEEELQKEAQILKDDRNVTFVILLEHYQTKANKSVAQRMKHIDLVIGGGNAEFLLAEGEKKSEKLINLVVPVKKWANKTQSPQFTVQINPYPKYVNNVTVNFDTRGAVINVSATSVLLDHEIGEAKEVSDLLKEKQPILTRFNRETVGQTLNDLNSDKETCKVECTIGNLLADSIREMHVNACKSEAKRTRRVDDCDHNRIALVNTELIKASIPKGKIIRRNLMDAFPFGIIRSVQVNGTGLWNLLEYSVKDFTSMDSSSAKFLQVSGLTVYYNLTKPFGSKVTSIIIDSKPLVLSDSITVLITDDYCEFRNISTSGCSYPFEFARVDMHEIVESYVIAHSPLDLAIEGRNNDAYQTGPSIALMGSAMLTNILSSQIY